MSLRRPSATASRGAPMSTSFSEVSCPAKAAEPGPLRAGSLVEVHSETAGGWVPAQVTYPAQEGKVTVEFAFDGTIHRKSVNPESDGLRLLQEAVDEEEEASIISLSSKAHDNAGGGEPTQREAESAFAVLKARESEVTSAEKPPARATAATKWERARCIAREARSVELWGCGPDHWPGVFVHSPSESKGQMAPTYQHQFEKDRWLYVSSTGSWWIGDTDSKDRRLAKGWMRSDAVTPGTLPHEVATWEEPVDKEWEPHSSMRFWLSESVAVEWQRSRIRAFEDLVISVRGVADAFVDGLYDFVPSEGGPGEPPVFQHQQRPNLWLFLAADQRWWIGTAAAKDKMDSCGIVHSATVHPGMGPCEASAWHVRSADDWEECRALKIQAEPDAARARDKWERSRRSAGTVEVWGKAFYVGAYEFRAEASAKSEPPVYQYRVDPDLWLYLAMDGSWWLSDTKCKDQRRAKGYMRSSVIEPGTLPQDVQTWREMNGGSWEPSRTIQVLTPKAAAQAWQEAREVARQIQVVSIEGVDGPSYNGLYDIIDSDGGPCAAPVFQHQINQDLFLYLSSDGRWCVASEAAMQECAPTGRMHSDVVQAGTLPTDSSIGWHVHNRSTKQWEKHGSVRVSA